MRPWEHRQAQIDGRRIQRIDGVGKVHVQIVAGIEPSGLSNQPLGKLGVDPPVAGLVGVRQCGAANRPTETHVVELGRLRRETCLDVAQALSVGDLGKRHHLILCGARQRPHGAVAIIARDNPIKRAPRQKIHQLRE